MKTEQELGLRKSSECSSKEKRCDRSFGMGVQRTLGANGTEKIKNTKQTNKNNKTALKRFTQSTKDFSPSDRKAYGEVATGMPEGLSKVSQLSRNARR